MRNFMVLWRMCGYQTHDWGLVWSNNLSICPSNPQHWTRTSQSYPRTQVDKNNNAILKVIQETSITNVVLSKYIYKHMILLALNYILDQSSIGHAHSMIFFLIKEAFIMFHDHYIKLIQSSWKHSLHSRMHTAYKV